MNYTHDKLRGGTRARLSSMRHYRDTWNDKQASGDRRYMYRTRLADGLAGALQARSHGIGNWNSDAHGITFADGGTDEQRETAWDRTQHGFWRDAGEAARECGYDGAFACGRSGGWCAPYWLRGTSKCVTFDDRGDGGQFEEFAERIETLYRAVPELFAANLRGVIEEDEQRARNAEHVRLAGVQRAQALENLVASLRALLACPQVSSCGRALCEAGDTALRDWDALQTQNTNTTNKE